MKIYNYAYFGVGQSNTYLALGNYLIENNYRQIKEYKFQSQDNNEQIILNGCDNITTLKNMLKSHAVDFAMIPIVNSDSGIVSFSSKMMYSEEFELVDVFTNEVNLSLYGLEQIDNLNEVRSIISNLPALSQCSRFVNRYMPFATYIKASSTTEAVNIMKKRNDPSCVCIANQSAENINGIIKIFPESINNIKGARTKYLIVKLREKQPIIGNTFEDLFSGYYVYKSENSEQSNVSVSPASFRFIKVKRIGSSIHIIGYVFGFVCRELFMSSVNAVSNYGKDYVFFYEYLSKHDDKTVNGLAKVDMNIDYFKQTGRMSGIYCGNGNNKSGRLQFARITEKEFYLYLGGMYENE